MSVSIEQLHDREQVTAWDADREEVRPLGAVVFYGALVLSTAVTAAGLFEIVHLVRGIVS